MASGKPAKRESQPSSAGEKRPYHHGNLRQALIDSTIELVGERGIDGFSVAEAARLAGVSPGAPYRHFPDRDALLAAASSAATEQLAAVFREALESSPD